MIFSSKCSHTFSVFVALNFYIILFLFHNLCSQMAVKQGNQLQMQVHEGYCVVEEAPPPIGTEKRPVARTGKKPLAHYSSLVRVLGSDMKTPEDPATQVRRE